MMLKKKKNKIVQFVLAGTFLFLSLLSYSQDIQPETLSYTEYVGYVKKYHPQVKQANLEISKAEAKLMTARGAFDPKIEVDFDKKEFKDKEYYSLLNSSFKIPTWYGIEVKAGFDNSEGIYVNPQNTLPNSGLTSLGVSVPIGQGLIINQRMADIRKAKMLQKLSVAERQLRAVDVIYEASVAYFDWLKAYNESLLYKEYLAFAEKRYRGITRLIELGDKPAIDSIEAGIVVKNRKLNVEQASLKLIKAKLQLSNYLWIESVPVELEENIKPDADIKKAIQQALNITELNGGIADIDNHPKVISLQTKVDMLTIERKLNANLLLPKVDLSYYYLSEPSYIDNFRFEDHKFALNFSFPIFLRKERGYLKLTKLKIQDAELDLNLERVKLKNKVIASQNEITNIEKQIELTGSLVQDYTKMLDSEERLFSFGESSIFLINSRENKLVSSKISLIDLENKYLDSYAQLFKVIAATNIPE